MTSNITNSTTNNSSEFNRGLLQFLDQSPTPFHAVATMVRALADAGFDGLQEGDSWQLEAGKRYFITRNDSSIIAFHYQPEAMVEQGMAMVGAHTDSPCLKVKPKPDIQSQGYYQLGVEVYGGALLNPWFDRDLSMAGRVHYRNAEQTLLSALIDFKRAVATIPSLAIHLHRDVNKGKEVNPQKHLPPVLMHAQTGKNQNIRQLIASQLEQQGIKDCDQVMDYELFFYDSQGANMVGYGDDFIASARLDNLLSCYVGLQALLATSEDCPALLVCNDHEEVGSASACGAQGPMLQQCLQRLLPDQEQRLRCIDRSMMISSDNAHGIHPNYADKHDRQHGPILNQGPVIKVNANQRYATNSETSSVFKQLCEQCQVPVQEFVTRSDMGCGSTIGPITASEIGVKTLDVGVPTFAMHSIRELAGAQDAEYLQRVLSQFFSR